MIQYYNKVAHLGIELNIEIINIHIFSHSLTFRFPSPFQCFSKEMLEGHPYVIILLISYAKFISQIVLHETVLTNATALASKFELLFFVRAG